MVSKSLGNLFIVAAPSGGGKTSLVRKLVEMLDDISMSVSHTTRDKRVGEVQGTHYHFIEEHEFIEMVDKGEFIEHARVFEHLYGTSRASIEKKLDCGIDVVLDIDWQGAEQVKALFPEAQSIFIMPPSLEALEKRLHSRKRDNQTVIDDRMQHACEQMSHYKAFDYLIVNDDFDKAASELKAIVVANRLKVSRQIEKQHKLLSFLLASQ